MKTNGMMSEDVVLYVKDNPDCTSLDIARYFGITITKAFTILNKYIERGDVFKTTVKSPTNGKKILGYRTNPNFDHMVDNADGSMSEGDVMRYLARIKKHYGSQGVQMSVKSLNRWRRSNGIQEIKLEDVL